MRLSININGVMLVAGELDGYEKRMDAYRNVVQSVRNNCPGSASVRNMLVRTLNDIMVEMNNEKSVLNVMEQKLEDCANAYRVFEENIVKCDTNTSIAWGSFNSGAETDEQKQSYWTWSDTWKIISNIGIGGSGISAIGNLVTGGTDPENILGSLEFVSSIVGGGASIAKNGISSGSGWWKYLVGFDNAVEKLNTGSFWGNVKASVNEQLIDDLNFNGAATTADKVKVGTKWAGHIITALTNVVDNYDEFKGNGVEGLVRGATETVIETGVDIGLGVAATGLVSAGLVALGWVGAPAIAVGAGAAVVTWGANAICKWATGGKDIGEVVADVYCDYVEDKVEAIKEGVQKVGEGIKEGVQKVGEGIKNVGESVKNGLSSAWSGICSVFG